MSLSSRITAVVQAIGADIKSIFTTLSGLGTAATQNLQTTGSDTTNPVLRVGAGGLLASGGGGIVEGVSTPTQDYPSINGFFNSGSIHDPHFGSYPAGIQFGAHDSGNFVTQLGGGLLSTADLRFRKKASGTWGQVYDIHHSGNQLSLGTTASSARAAIRSSIMPTYTLATLPSAPSNINMIAVVTDLPSGREPCISDGVNWLTLSDKAIAS